MPADRQETLWVLRAQVGDREALANLFTAIQAPLYRAIASILGDRALAEDVLQEVLLRIYQKLHWLRDPELFRPWCYRIATREVFRRQKRERRWSEQLRDQAILDTIEASPAEDPAEPELLAIVRGFLEGAAKARGLKNGK